MARPIAMPWRSPPESWPTVLSTEMPTPRKPIVLSRMSFAMRFSFADLDEAEAVGDLAADEEVAPERLFLAERLVLVHRLDRHRVRGTDRERCGVDLLVADEDAARRGWHDAGERLDERRFAGAVVADQADDLVPADREVDVAERMDRAEILLDTLHPDDVREVRLMGGLDLSGHCFDPVRRLDAFGDVSGRFVRPNGLPVNVPGG